MDIYKKLAKRIFVCFYLLFLLLFPVYNRLLKNRYDIIIDYSKINLSIFLNLIFFLVLYLLITYWIIKDIFNIKTKLKNYYLRYLKVTYLRFGLSKEIKNILLSIDEYLTKKEIYYEMYTGVWLRELLFSNNFPFNYIVYYFREYVAVIIFIYLPKIIFIMVLFYDVFIVEKISLVYKCLPLLLIESIYNIMIILILLYLTKGLDRFAKYVIVKTYTHIETKEPLIGVAINPAYAALSEETCESIKKSYAFAIADHYQILRLMGIYKKHSKYVKLIFTLGIIILIIGILIKSLILFFSLI